MTEGFSRAKHVAYLSEKSELNCTKCFLMAAVLQFEAISEQFSGFARLWSWTGAGNLVMSPPT